MGRVAASPIRARLGTGQQTVRAEAGGGKGAGRECAAHAVFREDEELVNGLLLKRASLIGKEDYLGRTPLHVAANGNLRAMVELLLKKKANTDVLDNDKMIPLSLAVSKGQLDAALALMAAGVDINALSGKKFRSVVHIAVKKRDMIMLRAVIEHGANVDVRDLRNGDAPLHLAAKDDNAEAVDAIVQGWRQQRNNEWLRLYTCARGC